MFFCTYLIKRQNFYADNNGHSVLTHNGWGFLQTFYLKCKEGHFEILRGQLQQWQPLTFSTSIKNRDRFLLFINGFSLFISFLKWNIDLNAVVNKPYHKRSTQGHFWIETAVLLGKITIQLLFTSNMSFWGIIIVLRTK